MATVLLVLGCVALLAASVARRRSPRLVRPLAYGAGALVLAAFVWSLVDGGAEDVRRGFNEGFESGASTYDGGAGD